MSAALQHFIELQTNHIRIASRSESTRCEDKRKVRRAAHPESVCVTSLPRDGTCFDI